MINNQELRKIIGKTKQSNVAFSRSLNRSAHTANVYLNKHKDLLPIKFSALVATHYPKETVSVIGKRRYDELLRLCEGLELKIDGVKLHKKKNVYYQPPDKLVSKILRRIKSKCAKGEINLEYHQHEFYNVIMETLRLAHDFKTKID